MSLKLFSKTVTLIIKYCWIGLIIKLSPQYGRVPLQLAAERGHINAVELLLREGASVESTDYSGSTALHQAAATGQKDIVQLLISKGCPVDARDHVSVTDILLTVHSFSSLTKKIPHLISAF
jgi:ankyrin repeat protein